MARNGIGSAQSGSDEIAAPKSHGRDFRYPFGTLISHVCNAKHLGKFQNNFQ